MFDDAAGAEAEEAFAATVVVVATYRVTVAGALVWLAAMPEESNAHTTHPSTAIPSTIPRRTRARRW